VGQLPGDGIALPGLVGQLGLKADEGAARPLLGLGCDQAVTFEDAPDRRHCRHWFGATDEVVGDGLRAGVVTGLVQLLAELENVRLDAGRRLVSTRAGW